jgi:hypothetical protein
MVYRSSRALYSLGLGLMHQTFKHFGSSATIDYQKLDEKGTEVRFTITQNE